LLIEKIIETMVNEIGGKGDSMPIKSLNE